MLTLHLVNHQRRDRIPLAWIRQLAGCAVRRLRMGPRGQLCIAFIDAGTLRKLHWRFLRDRRSTDVLSFRYAPARPGPTGAPAGTGRREQGGGRHKPIVGEILVAPSAAHRYARGHKIPYRTELGRYVIHGLLHWTGYHDRTRGERQKMRQLEDQLLAQCGALKNGGKGQGASGRLVGTPAPRHTPRAPR